MPRSHILLALLGGLVMSPAHAQPEPSSEVLRPILVDMLMKRVEHLNYIFPSQAKTSVTLETLTIGSPEKYVQEIHHSLDAAADPNLPIYLVVVQFTWIDRFGQAERKEKDYYCFTTFNDQWGCSPWSLTERDIP